MSVSVVEVKPRDDFLQPSLEFDLMIKHEAWLRSVIGVDGSLLAEDGRVLAKVIELKEFESSGFQPLFELGARGTAHDEKFKETTECKIPVIATLSERALNYIENTRRKNPKGDIILKLKLRVRLLTSRCRISYLQERELRQYGLRQMEGDETLIVYKYSPRDFSPSRTNMWVLSGDGNPVFLEVRDFVQDTNWRIPSNDWIYDYAPKLGIGKFVVVEIPEIEVPKAPEHLVRAVEGLKHVEVILRKGDLPALTAALNGVRNVITNHILTKIEKVGEQKIRHLNEELENTCLSKAPSESKAVYEGVLESIETSLRNVLDGCIHKFLHEDTGKLLRTPLMEDVEYSYMLTLSAIRYLSQLLHAT